MVCPFGGAIAVTPNQIAVVTYFFVCGVIPLSQTFIFNVDFQELFTSLHQKKNWLLIDWLVVLALFSVICLNLHQFFTDLHKLQIVRNFCYLKHLILQSWYNQRLLSLRLHKILA